MRQPPARYAANRIADFWISWAAGQPIDDTQSGFRLYPPAVLAALRDTRPRRTGFPERTYGKRRAQRNRWKWEEPWK